MMYGIDLGGTKIEIIALDGSREVFRHRIPTPQGDYAGTVAAIAEIYHRAVTETGSPGPLGIGSPGAISPATGLMKNCNSVVLNGKDLKHDIERTLGMKIALENDANCFALSEAVDGAGKDAEVVFGVILGTGTGGGIVVRGNTISGANAIGGEWGHNPLPWPEADELPGPDCYCGKKGCIETFISGTGLAATFRAATGRSLKGAEIDAAAQAGDDEAELFLQRYERRVAKCLATIINSIDPDVIVLGGGASRMERLYRNVPQIWGEYVFSDHVATQLLKPVYGDSSGVRGAAWLSQKIVHN